MAVLFWQKLHQKKKTQRWKHTYMHAHSSYSFMIAVGGVFGSSQWRQ